MFFWQNFTSFKVSKHGKKLNKIKAVVSPQQKFVVAPH